MIHIDQQHDFSDIALLERAAQVTLDHAGASTLLSTNADLTIVLTDDAQLHELNRDYLGVDAPTDVLSFPADEEDPESGVHYLGDILISIPRAKKQAKAAGHPLEAEVQLLVVHGALHLLGHDHAKAREKARMWKAQAEVMSKLGLGHIKVQET
jgi:probable rRNA maturation factor